MSEPDTVGGVRDRRPPKRARVPLSDLVLIVRPPGQHGAIRAFTNEEKAEADRYAAQHGVDVEHLAH